MGDSDSRLQEFGGRQNISGYALRAVTSQQAHIAAELNNASGWEPPRLRERILRCRQPRG
jgi:hypothetical protein